VTEAEILARMQARVEKSESLGGGLGAPGQGDVTSDNLNVTLYTVRAAGNAIGTLNPRNPGFINKLIQQGKRLIQRSLSWYTRSLHKFSTAVVDALQSHAIAISHTAHSLERTESRIEDLSTQTQQDILELQQRLEWILSTIENKRHAAETVSLRNQEDFVQLKSRLEDELSSLRSDLQAGALELRAVRQEIDRLRNSRQ
jgi:hypothetical protein